MKQLAPLLLLALCPLLPCLGAAEDEALFLRLSDGTVVALPLGYVLDYTYSGGLFTARLTDGEDWELSQVQELQRDLPEDLPSFAAFSFRAEDNSQVFEDVECPDPSGDTLSIEVGGIGKWLTASFSFTLGGTEARVDSVLQRSGKTRQSFTEPVCYTLTNPSWQRLCLVDNGDGTVSRALEPYCRKQTVAVRFLSDHPTTPYGVPRIDITLDDPSPWSSDNWIGMHGKTYYESALIKIDGAGVFPDLPETPVQIKGRGNTSWQSSWESKNPYHLKFGSKKSPLGMKEGKHWVLVANKQTGSLTSNAMGQKVANLLGVAYANHIVPVELYVNGSYRGAYDLTESIGLRSNSVDLEDETYAAVLELDVYTDEPIYSENPYSLPAKIHSPDLTDDGVQLTAEAIIEDFNEMVRLVASGTDAYLRRVDADYLARYLLTCEYIVNSELAHPKSEYLFTENVNDRLVVGAKDETPWVFGPLWDCDYDFGYGASKQYFTANQSLNFYSVGSTSSQSKHFLHALRYNSTTVDSLYYCLMTQFYEGVGLDELLDYCDEYYAFASSAFEHNRENDTSNRDSTDYALQKEQAKQWFRKRAEAILGFITPYDTEPSEEDTDTGLTSVHAIASQPQRRQPLEDTYYDLSGRPVARPTQRGVYIKGGRKVLLR